MPPDRYAETAVSVAGLILLAVGSLAMLIRVVLRRRAQLGAAGRQLVADVRRGRGFTFHRSLGSDPAPAAGPGRPGDAPAPPQAPLPLRAWLDVVNHRPDQVPHLFIEGGSGAGKTTLATAILHDRPGPVAIVGVKPDDGWGEGYVYKSADRPAFLALLLAEVRRRLDQNDRSGLTLVLDDFTRLAGQHREALELYKEVADIGRSLRIRLILIARGRLVKGIGAQGESDLLDHFVFLKVSRDRHAATLEIEEEARPLDTTEVRHLAQPLPAARWWRPTNPAITSSESDQGVLSRLLGDPTAVPVRDAAGDLGAIPAPHERTSTPDTAGTPHSEAVPDEEAVPLPAEGVPATLTPEAIRTLHTAGWSKNRIAALLSGTKAKRLGIIDAALGATPSSHEAASSMSC